jgi:hypothetical protein
MNCVVLQPSYIPWRGYFHQIQKADVFVFYDDVQYDRDGWRNRNRIKTPNGPVWLTIPVLRKGSVTEGIEIRDIRIAWDRPWNRKHWTAIETSYRRAPYFETYRGLLEPFYLSHPDRLADFTIALTVAIAGAMGLHGRRFVRSSELGASGQKTDRLVEILGRVGADHYVSGPSARGYLEEEKLARAGVMLEYMTYDYPEYDQLHPPYEAQVSILDLLFTKGPDAGRFIWGENSSP